MGSHSVTCYFADVTFLPLPQTIKAGTQFNNPGGRQGSVNLVGLVTYQTTKEMQKVNMPLFLIVFNA